MIRLTTAVALALLPVWALAESATAPVEAPPGLPAISVSTVTAKTLTDRVIATGLVGPVELVNVQPQIEGQAIEAVLADIGDDVAAGQVLARLSQDSLLLSKSQFQASQASALASVAQAEAQITQAQANRDEAMRQRDRAQALRTQGNVSQASADQAAAAAISAEASLAAARQAKVVAEAQAKIIGAQIADIDLKLARTEIKAPVAGEVVERFARIGAIAAGQGSPMYVIVKDAALELNAEVSEGDLLRLAPGQSVEMRLVGQETPVTGKVRLVEPTIDTTTRLGHVRILFNDQSQVRSGMFAEAEIEVVTRTGLAVPVPAVSGRGSGASVLRVVDGKVEKVAVTTGIHDGGYAEIVSGLDAGDQIVARAGSFVRPGDRINPVPTGAATASN